MSSAQKIFNNSDYHDNLRMYCVPSTMLAMTLYSEILLNPQNPMRKVLLLFPFSDEETQA